MSVSGCGFPGVCPAFPGADECAADTEETREGSGGVGADQGQSAALLPYHHDEGTGEGACCEARAHVLYWLQVLWYAVSVYLVFAMTISLFPALISQIESAASSDWTGEPAACVGQSLYVGH